MTFRALLKAPPPEPDALPIRWISRGISFIWWKYVVIVARIAGVMNWSGVQVGSSMISLSKKSKNSFSFQRVFEHSPFSRINSNTYSPIPATIALSSLKQALANTCCKISLAICRIYGSLCYTITSKKFFSSFGAAMKILPSISWAIESALLNATLSI